MNDKIQLVKNAMLAVQRYPWEQGVCAQALWELGDVATAVANLKKATFTMLDVGIMGTAVLALLDRWSNKER